MITASGVGSGLDINGIINQLMSLERRPLTSLQGQQRTLQTQLSDYGKLKSAISTFQEAMKNLASADKFKVFTATSSDENVLTATASSSAAIAANSVEVVRIAERHKMVADTTFTDTDTVAADTSMTITVGDTAFNVDIGGKTLAEVAAAINDADDNAGVNATVANVDGGARLILGARETGSTSALQVSYSSGDPFSLQTTNEDRNGAGGFTAADLDAVLVLDGNSALTATRSSNNVSDLITGVTLNLKKAGTVDLNVGRDLDKVEESAKAFADAFSALRTSIKDLRKGSLSGDSTLVSLENRLLEVINNPASGLSTDYSYLSEVGVSVQKDGSMKLDSTVFRAALEQDFNGVAALFSASGQGFAARFKTMADEIVGSDGLIDSRTDGINDRISDMKQRVSQMELRLVTIETRYRSQYAAMDSLLGSLRSTGDFLTQQLANL